ncbi:MAG: EutN/CcmL family microcompartment protein [Candidatus Schekmanbacteria bacterium]|nr:EutN/CcmL family microcompartment protein [Candidatus Schekmanbacteria bacterium]
MFLGRVMGTVVATVKHEGLEGIKLLLVEPLNHKLERKDKPIVVVDTMQAGLGEVVFLEDGREASMTLPIPFVPVDGAIVGIVDMVDTDETETWVKSDEL